MESVWFTGSEVAPLLDEQGQKICIGSGGFGAVTRATSRGDAMCVHHATRQTSPRSDRPSGPRGPSRLCHPDHPLVFPVGSPEAAGRGALNALRLRSNKSALVCISSSSCLLARRVERQNITGGIVRTLSMCVPDVL
jgi:hypothetical protein